MVSKILFLGTGGDCFTVGKQLLGSGGIILEYDDIKLHIDPGPGTLNRARVGEVNLRDITAVIATHNHIGHSNDVNAVIDAMTHNGFDRRGVLIGSKSVISGLEDESQVVSEFHKKCVERVITLENGKMIGIGDIDLLATPAYHSDPTTIGLKITTPDAVIGYTSDTFYNQEVSKAYNDCDILIMNVQTPRNSQGEEKKGMSSEDAEKLITQVKPRLAVITHFGLKMAKSDPIYEAREIQRITGIQTIAAKEGMQINPGSYVKSVQKKLN